MCYFNNMQRHNKKTVFHHFNQYGQKWLQYSTFLYYIDCWSYWHGSSSVSWHGWIWWRDLWVSWHGCRSSSITTSHGCVGWWGCSKTSHLRIGWWCTGVSRHWLAGVSHSGALGLWVQAIWLLVSEGGTIPARLRGRWVPPRRLGQHGWVWSKPPHACRDLTGLWFEKIGMS